MASEQENYYRCIKQYSDEDNLKKLKNLHLIVQVKNKLIDNNINPKDQEKSIAYLNTLNTKEICLNIYNEYIITEND